MMKAYYWVRHKNGEITMYAWTDKLSCYNSWLVLIKEVTKTRYLKETMLDVSIYDVELRSGFKTVLKFEE